MARRSLNHDCAHDLKAEEPRAPKSAFVRAVIWILAFTWCFAISNEAWAARSYSRHSGYLETIEGERESVVRDMLIVHPPTSQGPTLRERIFNDKLSREFRASYEEKFGRTEAERAYYSENHLTYYNDLYGFKGTAEEISEERRRFGEYMIRRLAEYHVDNYAQNDPTVRPVWEAKQRLQNVQLEVQRVRFDIAYSIAGNTLDINMVNPWMNVAQLRLQMNPENFGPTAPEETIFTLGRPLTPSVFVQGHYYLTDGIVSVVGRKALTSRLATTLTVSTFTKDQGKSRRESIYLSGLSYVF